MELQENISLSLFTTMRVGGLARYFSHVSTVEELREVLIFAKEKHIPFFVLGSGSNVLVSDKGFPGIVIKINLLGIQYKKIGQYIHAIINAGEILDKIVVQTISKKIYGLENFSFIPGTVGAAVVGNIGAYGVQIEDVVEWVEAIDINTLKIKKFTNAKCIFEYRDSFFTTKEGKKYIIIKVSFLLSIQKKFRLEYEDITNYIKTKNIKKITLPIVRNILQEIRMRKIPNLRGIGSAGSFFRNPIVSKKKLQELIQIHPQIKYYPIDENKVKIAAAWLLDHIGNYNGFREGNIGVCATQPLFILSYGDTNTKAIITFVKRIIKNIKEKTGITLEWEIKIIK